MRWVFCAADVCFATRASSLFFENGKAMPLRRGGGLDQPELMHAVDKLNRGDWVHIFPEGRVFQKQEGVMGPSRPGVGKLIAEAERLPAIVPFYHIGMENVRPIGRGPQRGHKVWVIVGDPIHVDDIVEQHRALGSPPYVHSLLPLCLVCGCCLLPSCYRAVHLGVS